MALMLRFGSLLRFVRSRSGEIAHTDHSISSHKRLHSLQTPISAGRTETAVFINTDAINSIHFHKQTESTNCIFVSKSSSSWSDFPPTKPAEIPFAAKLSIDNRELGLSFTWIVVLFVQTTMELSSRCEVSSGTFWSNLRFKGMGIDALIALQNRSSTHSHLRWLAPGEDFHSRHQHDFPGNV